MDFHRSSIRATAFAAIFAASAQLGAQLPGVPVLQNAFANPGVTVGVNGGGGSGSSAYGLAAAWVPGNGRFQLSAGVGSSLVSGRENRSGYGIRASIPILSTSTGSVGAALFGGVGGAAGLKTADSMDVATVVPLGATAAYRRAIGASHGISVYVSPVYEMLHRSARAKKNENLVRGSVGVDLGLTASLGATAGLEFGTAGAPGRGSPSAVMFGAGVSYAIGRH